MPNTQAKKKPASPARSTSKSRKKKVQTIRRKPFNLLTLVIFVAMFALSYWYFSDNDPITYGADQNEDGYYYYQVLTSGYYASANNLIGNALKSELHDILNEGFDPNRYQDAKTVLASADLSLTDPTKVYNVYDGALVPAIWDGTSWHREHVWPNSRLGMDRVTETGRNQASDLHNLRAITPSVNSSRSDRFYDAGSGTQKTVSGGGYYPGDAHKGDVARILFYMAIKYDFLILTDLGLEDESNHYTMEGVKMGKLSLLLEWHREDPVDDFERQRNQVIHDAQGNRNPFIDQPAYVHLIWEGKTIGELLEPEDVRFVQPTFVLFSMIGKEVSIRANHL